LIYEDDNYSDAGGDVRTRKQPTFKEFPMPSATDSGRALTRAVSADLASLRTGTPDVLKAFGDLGRAATAESVPKKKTKELIALALALSVALRCDPCIGSHTQTLAKLEGTRQEVDDALGAAVNMGGRRAIADVCRQCDQGL